ncbi:MAG: glycosyltransferase family 4 protein [Acidimicrobiia bacterium]|nr:glycosyltransferase family 4 protein [Acidimicrobiia bacterium]
MLAWRDIEDVEAGGSEIHAANVARLWAEAGLDVTMRASHAQGQPPTVDRDGYHVIRRAGRYLVFPRAVGSELAGRHGERDALVEIWNGMPFFSPLWATGPRAVWLHHVHAEMWRMVLPPNLARIGDTIESRIAPLIYRRSQLVTLSDSSRDELIDHLGFRADRVSVVPPGIHPRFVPGPEGSRSPTPLVVAAGRFMPVKRFDRLIREVAAVREHIADVQLVIIGSGFERVALTQLVDDLDATSWVTFAGQVDDDTLVELYQRAWVVASTSAREGWGMTITEAAACGTPAVATDISGHRDALDHGVTGLLGSADGTIRGELEKVLGDDELRAKLAANARNRAERFTWEATAVGTLDALIVDAQRRHRRTSSPRA